MFSGKQLRQHLDGTKHRVSTTVTKSGRIIRQRHKARMEGGGGENAYTCMLKTLKGGAYLEDVNIQGGIILKWTLSVTCVEKCRLNNWFRCWDSVNELKKTWTPTISCSVCHGIVIIVTIIIIIIIMSYSLLWLFFVYRRIKFEKYS